MSLFNDWRFPNICILKQEKKIEDVLPASNNLKQAHLIFLHIKKVIFEDIVVLLAHVTIFNDVVLFFTIFSQQHPNRGNEEEFELKDIFLQ